MFTEKNKNKIYAWFCVLIVVIAIYFIFFKKKKAAESNFKLPSRSSANSGGSIGPNPGLNPGLTPVQTPIKIDWVIFVKSVDQSKITNLTNGLGYAHKLPNGNWASVTKFSAPGAQIPVHNKQYFRGQFFIPTGLSNVNFQSSAFLLSTLQGDSAINPNNKVYLQVYANDQLIVDRRPNGFDAAAWATNKWDASTLVPVSY